jgi:hypothetical protein
MKFITQEKWHEIKKRYLAWWANGLYERPLLKVIAKKPPSGEVPEPPEPKTPKEMYLDIDYLIQRAYYYADTHLYMGDTYPDFCVRLGPGTLSTYLGSQPIFAWDTIWYETCMEDIEEDSWFKADPESYWFKTQMNLFREAKRRMGDDFIFTIPDLIENMDVLSNMRGAEALCLDMMDNPETVKQRIRQIDELYEYYYNLIYDFVKLEDNSSAYSAFRVWGPGKTAKIQCDFCALISVEHFREFVLPSLQRQCRFMNNTVFHLDGPQAMKHVDALMEIKELNALQFTCGEMRPDGTNEEWYEVYDKARAAGKALWVQVYDGEVDQWMKNVDRFIKRYGANGLYFVFPEFETEEEARELLRKAELDWH